MYVYDEDWTWQYSKNEGYGLQTSYGHDNRRVNDAITFEQNNFSKIHKLKKPVNYSTEYTLVPCWCNIVQQLMKQLEQ